VPSEGAAKRSRTDRVPYEQWIREGLITATNGSAVDQGFIREDINRIAREYRLRDLGFDEWNATKLSMELQGDGIAVVKLRQGFRDLSEATKHLSALVTGRALKHGGHPLLRWMASNMVVKQNADGYLIPDKAKTTERIDGIVALIMGLSVGLRQKTPTEPTVLIVGGR